MIASQLIRVIEQLGGRLYIQASGNLALSGISSNDPLKEKLTWLIKKHKTNLTRILTTPTPTREELTERIEQAIEQEHALDLFDKHDLTYKIEVELSNAASVVEGEYQTVADMRVDFDSLIDGKCAGQRITGTRSAHNVEDGTSAISDRCESQRVIPGPSQAKASGGAKARIGSMQPAMP